MTCTKRLSTVYSHENAQHLPLIRRLPSICRIARKLSSTTLGIAFTLILSACGGGGSSDTPPANDDPNDPSVSTSCDTAVQNQWVYNNMLDYYLFYDQVPQVNPQAYSTPEELLRAIRFTERDPYSFLTDASAASLQFEAGREFGLGYRWANDDDGAVRLTRVVADSPFGRAGLERGDIIISLNGIPWNDFPFEDFFENVFGSAESPVTSTWQLEKSDTGEILDVEITTTEYAINTVLHKELFINPSYSGTIGYVAFSRFLETSRTELQTVFQEFNDENITDLVLDLRYNGGGLISIAEYLASLIAGNSRADQLLYKYDFNDKYTDYNFALQLQNDVGDLGLSRLIVLTKGNTASASEIVLSGLQPLMEVVTMGSTTSGKPYIQSGRDRCDQQLNAIEAEGFNAAGVSVFGGVPAACYAKDDITLDFGINYDTGDIEGMLDSALDYIVFGTCLTEPFLAAHARSKLGDGQAGDALEKQGIVEMGGAIR